MASGAPASTWGYAAATLAFLLSSVQAAPALAAMSRLARGHWASRLNRMAELLGLSGLITAPLGVILLYRLPDWKDRPSIWFGFVTAPQAPDAVAFVLFAATGLTILRLADRSMGTPKQWRVSTLSLALLGAFYIGLLLYVDMLVASDLAVSLVPGSHSSDMVVYQVFTGFQGTLAAVTVAVACVRHFGRLQESIGEDVFKALSKLLLGFSLLFIWFFWAEFLTFWYGRLPAEKDLMRLFMFDTYVVPFGLSILCNFILPVGLLIWNSVRASIRGTTVVAAIILIGNLADRVRLYVASWSLSGPVKDRFGPDLPPVHVPTLPDVLILLGGPAAVICLILLALRYVAPIAPWEYQRDRLLRVEQPYLQTTMPVVAKPE